MNRLERVNHGIGMWIAVALAVLLSPIDGKAIFPDWCGVCAGCNDNPYAQIEEFWSNGTQVQFTVGLEYQTSRYEIQTTTSVEVGIWSTVADVESGLGTHVVPLATTSDTALRIVEVDNAGGRRIVAGTRTTEGAALAYAGPPHAPRQPMRTSPLAPLNPGGREANGALPDLVVFAPDTLASEIQDALLYWGQAYTVSVVTTNGFGDPNVDAEAVRQSIRGSIQTWASGGAKHFLLVGDANDWEAFDGPLTASLWTGPWEAVRQAYLSYGYPAGGQPDRNVIPTYIEPDNSGVPGATQSASMPYFFTDQPYADTDVVPDGRMDVVVTRWPVATKQEAARVAEKAWRYDGLNSIYQQTQSADVWIWDWFNGYINSTNVVRAAGAALEDALHWGGVAPRATSRIQAMPQYGEGDLVGVSVSRWWRDLFVLIGTGSSRYSPANYLSKQSLVPFDIGMLPSYEFGMVFAMSCGSGNFAGTESGYFGTPVCEDMIVGSATAGAITWLGPTQGTWQQGNLDLAAMVVDELNSAPSRSVAETWLEAARRYYDLNSSDTALMRNAKSYVFLGDPVSIVVGRPATPTPVGELKLEVKDLLLSSPRPNPSAASAPITLVVGVPRQSSATLRIVNVEGRVVRAYEHLSLAAGYHELSWDGRDSGGRNVAAGVYFAVLSSAGHERVRKVTVLR